MSKQLMSKQHYIRREKGIKENLPRFFLLIAFFVVLAIFGMINSTFLKLNNLMNLLALTSIIGILACGNMILMAAGEMSFSIGAQSTLIGAMFGSLLSSVEFNNIPLAFLAAFAGAIAIGLILGLLTVKLGVPTFVCTLALATIFDGGTRLFTNSTTLFSKNWPDGFTLMQEKIGGVVPVPIILFLVIAIITHIVYERMQYGRHLYAVGSNVTAAVNSGIPVQRVKMLAFAINGAFCGVAGIVAASYNNSVSLTIGSELLLPAIAATILSATFLKLGKYNVPGTVLAALLMIVVQNGVISAGYPIYVKDIVQGILLTIAVAIIALFKEDGLPSVRLES